MCRRVGLEVRWVPYRVMADSCMGRNHIPDSECESLPRSLSLSSFLFQPLTLSPYHTHCLAASLSLSAWLPLTVCLSHCLLVFLTARLPPAVSSTMISTMISELPVHTCNLLSRRSRAPTPPSTSPGCSDQSTHRRPPLCTIYS